MIALSRVLASLPLSLPVWHRKLDALATGIALVADAVLLPAPARAVFYPELQEYYLLRDPVKVVELWWTNLKLAGLDAQSGRRRYAPSEGLNWPIVR